MAAGSVDLRERGQMSPLLFQLCDVELNGETVITFQTGFRVVRAVGLMDNDTTNDTYNVKCKKSATKGAADVWCTHADVTSTVCVLVLGYN